MPKYRVSVSYDLTIYETYEVEVNREDYDSDEDFQAAKDEFDDSPYDFCYPGNRTRKDDGDVRNGSWHEDVQEIPVLDQMVQAVGPKLSTMRPEDFLGLPYREGTDDDPN